MSYGQRADRCLDANKQDLNLPKSIITRLAKGVLPPNTQIQANAILALSKSATVFISHLSNAYVVPVQSFYTFDSYLQPVFPPIRSEIRPWTLANTRDKS